MNTGTKTQSPVSFEEAQNIHSKLIREKLAKGYTPGADGAPYSSPESSPLTGITPQLLNPVDEEHLDALLDSPDYYLQQKHDGRRLLVQKSEDGIRGINRRGLECGIPETIREAAKKSRDTGSSMERLLEKHSMYSISSNWKALIFADQPTSRGLLF
jgi:bifunctional non-homologous end joining protein LigD